MFRPNRPFTRLGDNRDATGRLARAFTLIELLVVVSVITVLIAILLPSLAAARHSARGAVCASNVHQIALGWTLYAQDNRDAAVAGRPARLGGDDVYFVGNGYKYRPRWLITLGAAVQIYAFNEPSRESAHQAIDNRLLICPEARERTSERNTSYGYNFQFLGNARLTVSQRGFVNFPVRTSAIRGSTVVLADSLGTAAHFPVAQRSGYRADGSGELKADGNHAYMLDPPRLTPAGDFCDDEARGVRGGPADRHSGRATFGYADGHAELLLPEKVGYRRNPDGSYMHAGQNVINQWFSGTGRDDDPPRIDRP